MFYNYLKNNFSQYHLIQHIIKLCVVFLVVLICFKTLGSDKKTNPYREFRGLWIATIYNTDWPSSNQLTSEQQKNEFCQILDRAKFFGFNAIIVQVRSLGDAFYPSQYYPWSSFLTGRDNLAPSPYYDPLALMIHEAHIRGLEFHAWFNPFRLATTSQYAKLSVKHPAKKFASSTITYDKKIYFDPGNPTHQNFVINGILEVVKKYDIDAIHLDDYFYPYPVNNENFNDTISYKKYKSHNQTLASWRRQNINTFVYHLNQQIKKEKSWVKFGISPFGIWRNRAQDPRGSNTTSPSSSYDRLYADSVLWAQRGWIDYIIPQIYWHFYQSGSAYEEVLKFWVKEAENFPKTHLYIGHALYKVGNENGTAWKKNQEIPRQIVYNRQFSTIRGSAFYNTSSFIKNPLRVCEYFSKIYYKNPALIPNMSWFSNERPKPVRLTDIRRVQGNSAAIIFKDIDPHSQATYYIIYRFRQDLPKVLNSEAIIGIVGRESKDSFVFVDKSALLGFKYIYYIKAANRFHNESAFSNGIILP